MLRATKKLISRLFCLNMKKAKNQRRLVIIVALIGVYYLGKHSSSLNLRASEPGEKRILRDPPYRSTKSVASRRSGKQQQQRPSLYFGDLLKSGRSSNDNQKILQKGPSNGVHHDEKVVIKSTELAFRSQDGKTVTSKPESITPPFAAGQTDQQVKNPQQTAQNRSKSIKQLKGTSQMQIANRSGDTANQPAPTQTDISQKPNAGQVNYKSLADKTIDSIHDKSKPTPRTSSQSEQTTKPTAFQTVSTEGSTASNSEFATTNTTTAQSKIVNPDKVDRHLQNLLKEKKLFGFVDKNGTEQLQSVDILRTESYSKFLQYQISKKTELPIKLNSQNNGDLYKYGYSKATSDKMALLRNLPDNRDSRCGDKQFVPSKLDISVISVAQYTDSVSVILRMLISVLHRTPQNVLREIILVNDGATWDKEESNLLQLFVTKLPKVNMVNHSVSIGLARCMNIAAKMATGQVLAFLSPKVEVNIDWHVSLLAWLAENPNDMVLPVIDPIHWNNLEYSRSKIPVQIRGGFTWGLSFRWKAIPSEEKQRRQNLPVELRTPVYNGAIILMKRLHYNTILGANEAIVGHDSVAVALELSFKHWMCGGLILTIPCSRVGFVYAMESPLPSSRMIKNRKVIADSLMDDYRRHFYNIYFLSNKSAASEFDEILNTTKTLTQKLNCLSFKWYIENIYIDKKEPLVNSQYAGLIRGGEMCVDAMTYSVGRPAICKICNNRSSTQLFDLDDSGLLIFDEDFILGQRKSKSTQIEVLKRRTMSKGQQWRYDLQTTHLVHTSTGLCMSCQNRALTMVTCDDKTQGWKFDWTRSS